MMIIVETFSGSKGKGGTIQQYDWLCISDETYLKVFKFKLVLNINLSFNKTGRNEIFIQLSAAKKRLTLSINGWIQEMKSSDAFYFPNSKPRMFNLTIKSRFEKGFIVTKTSTIP